MKTKLLQQEGYYRHIFMSYDDAYALCDTEIQRHTTKTKGDFMLLGNECEIKYLESCGLDLSEVFTDYFIVHVEVINETTY